ncbi:long-chain fatty acid--CoA ligase [Fusobacterium necrophorum]|uniref:AMP-binding protein n=1 Tax=Fusobacterium necrophorum TaxID=859 RepID=UPI000887114A|nr:class I adenylate-forming enzyme family protein [Fusobacterium necrophorum]AYZ74223.1 long-chain fatty acid--CoA ligase [Fusobacterium necrophorum]AZW09895.1 long-chain fatty acid--CoA ligase [Fusobacterium necrophorum subsp. necrophorum]SDB02505.1 Acyl-CoA synthetase (AMP-forming)/AMP-acid ligase II [Fusobacterium necrophorum]SQD08626.1 Short-chain-fatty-acid--CoA ligase [Fusobacterium necrophorum subsp. necrophorum]
MNQNLYYKGEPLNNFFIENEILYMCNLLRKKCIKDSEIVICKSDSQLGVYIQWEACLRMNLIPLFIYKETTENTIAEFRKIIAIRAIIEYKNNEIYLFSFDEQICETNVSDKLETGSVIHITSGSTGCPKLVLRTKHQMEEELNRYANFLEITDNDVVFPLVPLNHSFGFISGMLLSKKFGLDLILYDNLIPRNILNISNKSKVSIMLGLPYFYKKMIGLPERYKFNSELRYIISSGGPIEKGIQKQFFERFDKKLYQQYGSTETGSLSIGYSETNSGYVGKPFDGIGVNVDEVKRCIYVDTPKTIGAYITKNGIQRLDESIYKMGDIGRVIDSGGIELLGRDDDIIIINGNKIDKKLVIRYIKKFNYIEEVDVFLRNSHNIEELICEYISSIELDKSDIISFLSKYLSSYEIPKIFKRVKQLSNKKKINWKT